MMARDYSGLDVRSAMGGAGSGLDGSGQVAIGSLWNGAEIMQVDQVFSQLQQSEQVDYAELYQATQLVQRGLHHPTYAMDSQGLIEAMYHLTPTAEGQAYVIGDLLKPDNVGLVRDLLTIPEETNHLAERLGPQGTWRLLDIAATSNPIARIALLSGWARYVVLPESYSDTGELGSQVQPIDYSGVDPEFTTAMLENDTETIKTRIAQATDLTALARGTGALLGEQARPVLSQLAMDSDSRCRGFAFQALQFLAELNLDHEQIIQTESSGEQPGGTIIDTAELEILLSAPDSLPASLAARFGCSPVVQACLLELIVRD